MLKVLTAQTQTLGIAKTSAQLVGYITLYITLHGSDCKSILYLIVFKSQTFIHD